MMLAVFIIIILKMRLNLQNPTHPLTRLHPSRTWFFAFLGLNEPERTIFYPKIG
jgi:hypothetical protein